MNERMMNRPDDAHLAWMHSRAFVPLVLLGLTLAMFGGVLFLPGDRVLSVLGMDTSNVWVYWRKFGFDQLRAGHLALWNPHVFSGCPFVGDFQTALLYPPNWILYLTLPLTKAINYEYALHVFLLGLFMAMWASHYKLHPLAVLLAACAAMFARSFLDALPAGNLPPLDSMAWVPLILLSIDGLLDQPSAKWILIGIFAFSMQILSGFPEVLFHTIVTGAIYGAIRLIRAPRPVRTILALSVVGIGAILIAAGPLWAGLQAAGESTREAGKSLAISSLYPLSYDSFVTLLMPDFFGSLIQFWAAVVVNLFFGLTGLTMAIVGTTVKSPHRVTWIIMVVVLLGIALGHQTPLFRLLYRVVPGFDHLHRPAEYSFEAMLFVTMLSAVGMDALIRSARGVKTAAVVLLIVGLALGVFGGAARAGVSVTFDGIWHKLAGVFAALSLAGILRQHDHAYMAEVERYVGVQCLIAAGTCLVLAALMLARSKYQQAAYILAVFGVVEAFAFARSDVTTFHLAEASPTQVQQFVAAHPGDYRILNPRIDGVLGLPVADSAVLAGANDISGYDPLVPRRYSEFMNFSLGFNPDDAGMVLPIWPVNRVRPMWRLLRLRYLVSGDSVTPVHYPNSGNQVAQSPPPLAKLLALPPMERRQWWEKFHRLIAPDQPGDLPHILLVDGWRRIEHRDDILAALNALSFDATKTVILERDPKPAPVSGPTSGTARLLSSTSDSLTIAADVPRPALLLVTDSYSRYWRAVSLKGSSQSEYQVMPADYTIMAVPIGPGHHFLRLEYAPSGWIVGRWISLASLLIYLIALVIYMRPALAARWANRHPA